jgi:hypothetical protein
LFFSKKLTQKRKRGKKQKKKRPRRSLTSRVRMSRECQISRSITRLNSLWGKFFQKKNNSTNNSHITRTEWQDKPHREWTITDVSDWLGSRLDTQGAAWALRVKGIDGRALDTATADSLAEHVDHALAERVMEQLTFIRSIEQATKALDIEALLAGSGLTPSPPPPPPPSTTATTADTATTTATTTATILEP